LTRHVVARQRRAEWRYAITNHTGHLIRGGITRHRPDGVQNGADGGVVELHIPATLLARLAANPPPGWAGVISDLARQYAAWPATKRGFDQKPGRRLPTTGLRRHTQIRDRTCRGPGCRLSAIKTEFDHTRDYRHGGPTVEINGGNVCDHDHDLKTKGGWRLEQPEPGTFTWISPLGQTHTTQGEPIITPTLEPGDDDPPPF
ncbi:HNH endonuclease signature motif containing protein, partial [Pseudonocardia acaciae]|uniref:HNH endonuclease signature motif containing protein n=1 Tax=Pseudonocardia acaciae TaxID=551276 RepID=UPI00048B50E5